MARRKGSSTSRSSTPAQSQENDLEDVEVLTQTTRTEESVTTAFTDDASWEDEPDYNLAHPHEMSPPPLTNGKSSTARRRKPTSRKIFVAQPNAARKGAKAKGDIPDNIPPLVNVSGEQVRGALSQSAAHTAEYFFDIVKTSLRLLRKPLSFFLFVYILAYLLTLASGAFRTLFAPICWIPGISRTPICYRPPELPRVPRWADYPKLAEMESSTFEQLLDATVGNSALSLEIKKAEMATQDLIALIKVSDFKSKDLLANNLEGFVEAAKKTGRGLQRFSSRVSGAVDSIVAVNDHAYNTIQSHVKSKSALARLNPFSNALTAQQVVTQTFADAMSVLSAQMQRVILEAEANMHNLDTLENQLLTLHEMVHRENATISAEKEEVLAELWTFFGGNRRKLRGLNGHLFLLRNIGAYRARAAAHVAAALQALEGMSEDMEDLRERVTAPELIGDRIPVEVHMKSIRAGLERLQQGRTRAQEREEETVRRLLGVEAEEN